MRNIAVLISSLALLWPAAVNADPVPLLSVEAFPNGRVSDDLPPNAIDGNLATFTWTTNAYNTSAPSYLAVAFAATRVNRLRLWKTPEGGGGENFKNLTIEVTTDASGPLSARRWTRVSGLANGFGGQELLRATAVKPDGTISGDRHNSPGGDGWASLTFNTVRAAGLRIAFSSPGLNHYRVGELQVFAEGTTPPPPAPPVPDTSTIVALTTVEAFPNGRVSDDLPPNAIDGNPATFTWTTNAYNTRAPSYLAVGFAATRVNRLRLWKTPEGGGGENFKDLVIEVTTDASGPLSARRWTRVSGLTNGFGGQELLRATAVKPDGTISGDRHDSLGGDGWASLTFDPINALGLRIGFSSPGLVHYRVGELQVLAARPEVDGPSTTRKLNDIETQNQEGHESPGVKIEAFPFTAQLDYVEEYVRDSKDSSYTLFRPTVTLKKILPLRPGSGVAFKEEAAIPELGFQEAAFSAAIAPRVEALRLFLASKRTGAQSSTKGSLVRNSFPVRCSYSGFSYLNQVAIRLTLNCIRDEESIPADQRDIELHVPQWSILFPEKQERIETEAPLQDFLLHPYCPSRTGTQCSPLYTVNYRIEAKLNKSGDFDNIKVKTSGGDKYEPKIEWGDNFKIVSITIGNVTLKAIPPQAAGLKELNYVTSGGITQALAAAVFNRIVTALGVISFSSVLYSRGLEAALASAVLFEQGAGGSLTFSSTGLAQFLVIQAIAHHLETAKVSLLNQLDRIEERVREFARFMARDIAMTRYYGEVYPYRRELLRLQFILAAGGQPVGDRVGEPYACAFMMCQNTTSGRTLAVLPPAAKEAAGLKSLWQVQEKGVWREICRDTCPLE